MLSLAPALARAESIEAQITRGLGSLGPSRTETLYDRVLPLSGIERFRGEESSAPASFATWRQLYDELRRASNRPDRRLSLDGVERSARALAREGAIPIAVLFDRYERIRSDALAAGNLRLRDGRLERGVGEPLEEARAFAAAATVDRTYRGHDVSFVLDPSLFFSHGKASLEDVELDAGDGLGFRRPSADHVVRVRYDETGSKTLRLRARSAEEGPLTASFVFAVEALATPSPNDTLHVTATIPYQGGLASGKAYVYLAAGRTQIQNPVVVVEGFDLENTLGWDPLYERLNRQNLLEDIRARGFDTVVLDFADATDYIQRNAFVLAELLRQIESSTASPITVVGASMGGVIGRYALAWLETRGISHRVTNFICFDAPNRGANVPLGIQYWVQFFAGQSSEAARLLERLDRPAVRQMLVYHYTNPPSLGQADPLKVALLNEFVTIGKYPTQPRLVGIANGSGNSVGQGFAPSSQLVQWNYHTFWIGLLGDVWALPVGTTHKIFDGEIRLVVGSGRRTVSVSSHFPYDNAPGAWRNTMAEMDAAPAPYGDIVAFYPNHSFVPTTSALDLATTNLFYNVAADPNRLSRTPFDAIYWASTNQEHVFITPENAGWLRQEITGSSVAVPTRPIAAAVQLAAPWPSPSSGEATRIGFDLPRPSVVKLSLFDVRGRLTRQLLQTNLEAGPHQVSWDGRDGEGRRAAAGIYFIRLEAGGETRSAPLVRLE